MIEVEGVLHLTVPETAARLGVSHQWVRYLISHGRLPAVRVSQKRMLVPVPAIAEYEAWRPTEANPVPVVPETPVKRKRGRPVGSKNRPKVIRLAPDETCPIVEIPTKPEPDPDEVL